MKKRGQQKLSQDKQSKVMQILAYFGKSDMRAGSDALWAKTQSNVARMADQMIGFKNVRDFGLRTMRFVDQTAKADGLGVAARESLKTTMLAYTDLINKPEIRKALELAENKDIDIKRSTAERIKPQYHTSWEDRLAIQARIEAKEPAAGIAAAMSLYSGTRFEESLASCEFLMKDAAGKYHTTTRMAAGELRELKIKDVRYAFTDNRKDKSFEKEYLKTMIPGMTYVVVAGSWAKLSRTRLIPVFSEAQRTAAINAQAFIRNNKAAAKEFDRKVQSVISPDRTRDQGKAHFEYILKICGLTKAAAGFSLHADRTEFCQRMKRSGLFTDAERSLAMGHGAARTLEQYGG